MLLGVISSEKIAFAIAIGVPVVVALAVVMLSVPRARGPIAAGVAVLALAVIAVAAVPVFEPLADPAPGPVVDAGGAGAEPTGSEVTEPASPTAKAAPCEPSGTTVRVVAKNIEFDTDCLAAPADQALSIQFENQDPNIPHNVSILDGDEHAFEGEIFNGARSMTYQVSPLAAGTYTFRCDVHPQMEGTFVVAPAG